ncbi:hypothetical protein DFH07DRAFT_326893 [Mycena maculata]|uniref:F-box domain-containing protein n=1 Tax=Mycena maculata TaxID=230809 RepID=A0AAD7JMQ3_9AGAR|nr:hypothetical protein DFH07DRAFT_326893 [Mycena maculata]
MYPLSLPVELWLYILSLRVHLRDLAALCLTCSQLLSISRPILFRHLTLRAENSLGPNFAVIETFALLTRDKDLACSVRELTLDSRSAAPESYYRNPGLVHIASMRNLTQLKRVTIIGDISRHAGAKIMIEFVQILHDLQLDELRFPAPGVRAFILELGHIDLAFEQFANPKRLEFYMGVDHHGLLALCLLRIFTAATPSLTSLSLIATHLYSGSRMRALFDLHFPLLRSLTLNSTSDEELACPPGFNSFLMAHHHTLQELRLGYTSCGNIRAFGPSALVFDGGSGLHSDFLPDLRVFQGHCRNVEMMAHARMRCLTNLRELTIGSGLNEARTTIADLGRMFDAIDVAGRLESLATLDFDLFRWHDLERDFIPTFIRRVGAICGTTLEVWSGLLPYLGSWSTDVFAVFPHLRAIRFPTDSMVLTGLPGVSTGENGVGVVQGLAGTCPMLEEVAFQGAQDECWKIDRHRVSGTMPRRVDQL